MNTVLASCDFVTHTKTLAVKPEHEPVGQGTHEGIDQKLHQSLGGKEESHTNILLVQEGTVLLACAAFHLAGVSGDVEEEGRRKCCRIRSGLRSM